MTILIASDHAGYDLKEYLKKNIQNLEDLGCKTNESVDYPDYAIKLVKQLNQDQMGILICGSGQGMAITANKAKNIRAALCWTKEIAKLAREHNNANILCLPSRFISEQEALKIVSTFVNTEFEGGRHQRRLEKIKA